MHAVYKASSTTTKVRAVFDASAKSSTGVSLNDTLLVGPTIHPPLVDVLLRFRSRPVALTADVSKMYRAIELTDDDKDLHRFVWRSHLDDPLKDYRMTRVTFGVSASSFAANMAVKRNAFDYSQEFPLAAEVVHKSFYVDDCLTGAADSKSALLLQQQLTELFSRGGFVLRKWNSNDCSVMEKVLEELRDSREVHTFSEATKCSKTLGIEWNVATDQFHLCISKPPSVSKMTKRNVVSDVAKVFNALGLFSPVTTVKMKILLQRLWETKLDWDDPVPDNLLEVWSQCKMKLPSLSTMHVPRCYSPIGFSLSSVQLHGFSDASEEAYAGVVYLCLVDPTGKVHTAIVMSKTRVKGCQSPHLTVKELKSAEDYWLMIIQKESFPKELDASEKGQPLPKNSRLLPFRPICDKNHSVLRVGGRLSNSSLSYSQSHPVILDGKHPITKLIILSEHRRLMHAGPTLLLSPLNQRFHIVGARRTVRFITRQCIMCKHHAIKPHDQLLGQPLPLRSLEWTMLDPSRSNMGT